ncbi:phytanoyl-CoA dioxygenase family protein [Fimbriimonas ginsengisoli]|uniref:Putative phytanoyl-CoA dioxygenase n=1 Tax=Fimbriimonas ginsengisoli Gsoil 348 TaxID=661478 RepID=A0A068NWR0_FIMGI|nr:phytanoyl-CoA dioxygenase family protein [Fimbriimonas ginsengisoli]AIE87210.1 putative phytanoyl-CoA dioxygenase [Fimbriimonas ginsengisoli Gsoil 348]
MQIEAALARLGVCSDSLSAEEKRFLDENGYLVLRDVLNDTQIEGLRLRLDELLAEEGEAAGLEVHQEKGTDRLSDLVNKGEVFDVCFTHPKVLAGIAHVLKGDLKLSSLNARFAKPGEGLQGLHADWGRLETPGDFQVCNSIWLLDDFTEENGATRLVPGSHRWGSKLPGDDMADPSGPHPEEKLLVAPAGTVVIFNSHTWHGGTLNRTDKRRRAMHSYFCRRHQPQQLDQKKFLRPETRHRLSEAARTVLDVDG